MTVDDVDQSRWEVVPCEGFSSHDSIWALACGADGHIYFGLAQEYTGGGVAQLFRYHTRKRRLEHLADLAQVTGEASASGHATQGKIHFALCPASDGRLYGATHCTTFPMDHRLWSPVAMWGDPVHSYPGGHIFRYDPADGRTVDFGVICPNEGIPYLLLDEGRERLYGVTYPRAHFFRVDLAGRAKVDYGRVSGWYPIAMCFDARKNIFMSDVNAQIVKYDVAADRLVFTRRSPFSSPWNRTKRHSWIANLALAEDGFIYGTHYATDRLFRFDPERENLEFDDLGPGVPGGVCGALRGLTPDGRGHLYYQVTLFGKGPSLFVRYHLRTGRKDVLGRLRVGGINLGSWIGVMDRRGRLYVKGGGRPMSLAIYTPPSRSRL